MLKIGKLAQQAIAAASYLAERHDEDARVSAGEIAEARKLSRTVLAKVLATLSLRGITSGTTGPTGGYRLARAPGDISLFEIVSAFERTDVRPMCPFGPHWCGSGDLCPLHDGITAAAEKVEEFLKTQNLGPFRERKRDGQRTASSRKSSTQPSPRRRAIR
ncbi:MAG: Rrf2 family transcriptional regulator [Verrucomicrobiaceae bacterium]|nr:Rrf2 family transcriptional regulator [Verrucomicrobiaceae bacterium]